MARRGRFARSAKGSDRPARQLGLEARLSAQAKAGEDEQVGGADLQQQGAGVVGEGADDGRGERRRAARRASPGDRRSQAREPVAAQRPRAPPAAAISGRKTKTIGRAKLWAESCRRRWATSARSPSPPASSTERVRWALAPETRSTSASSATRRERRGDHEQRRAPAPAPAIAAAATAAPTGRTIAAPTSAPKRPAAKTKARTSPTARKATAQPRAREPRREAGQRRPGAGDDQHAEQRLQLVADPVEAHAEPRVGAEQRERGERRAGDHVDRVGEDGQRRRPPPAPGSRRAPPASAPRAAARRASTSSCSTPWLGSSAAPSSSTSGR